MFPFDLKLDKLITRKTLSRHHLHRQLHLFSIYRLKELRDLEQATIKSFGILGESLMKIASTKAAYWIQKHESLKCKGYRFNRKG